MNVLRNFALIVISYNFLSFFYVAPLKPCKLRDRFMYVFFSTECTQDLEKCDGSFEHVPNLICALNVKSWTTYVSIVNGMENVLTCSDRTL